MRGICFNWKVAVSLGVAALGVVVVAPHLALAVLPILVLAACPLSCIFMMRGMGRGSDCRTGVSSATRSSVDSAAMSQDERVTRLEAEIQRLRAPETDATSELGRSEPTGPRQPVA